MKTNGNQWQKTLWKILTNPAIEALLAIVLVILATWLVVSTEDVRREPQGTVPFAYK